MNFEDRFRELYFNREAKKIEKLKKFPPKVVENRILFETKNDFDGEGRFFYEYLIEHGYNKKYEIIWLVKHPEEFCSYKVQNVSFVGSCQKYDEERKSSAAYRCMLSSHYIFYDQSVNWIGMTRKKQLFVNLWHGCAYAVNADRRKTFFDLCLTPGEAFNLPMKEAFGCTTKKMLPLGYPHYDKIMQGSKEAAIFKEKLLRKSGSSRLVLWYPVLRKNIKFEDVKKLDDLCRELKIHLLIKNTILEKELSDAAAGEKRKLSNITKYNEDRLKKVGTNVYELLHETDGLLSDYASLLVDFLLLDRPTGYIMTRLEEGKRWIFEGYPQFMPGHHMESVEDICQFLKDLAEGNDKFQAMREQRAKEILNIGDHYCQRIADCIF